MKFFLKSIYSCIFLLLSSAAFSQTWIGGTGSWDNAANWTPGAVPTGASTVTIGAGAVITVPAGVFDTKNILISAGGQITIAAGATLNINGTPDIGLLLTGAGTTVTNNGTLNCGNFAPIVKGGISLLTSSTLINNTGAVITINDIASGVANEGDGISIQSNSSVTNSGSILIGNTAFISRSGVFMETGGQFTNQSTGTIQINRISTIDGIDVQGGSSFTNSGNIQIGNTTAVNRVGLFVVTGSQFTNQSTGVIDINRITTGDAVQAQDISTTITNNGIIHCGNAGTIKKAGVSLFSGSALINSAGAIVTIDNITSTVVNEGFGVSITSGTFTNNGTVQIGNTTAISRNGLLLTTSGQLTNQNAGVIEINRVTANEGFLIQSSSTVSNFGTIKVGNVAAVNTVGMSLATAAQVTNQSTGIIEINRTTTSSGIVENGTGTVLNNSGSIKIGNLAAIASGGIGLGSSTQLTNLATGVIEINRITALDGIAGTGGTLTNSGSIKIGNLAAISQNGINIASATQIVNQASGIIEINSITTLDGISASGTGTAITNSGSIKIGNSAGVKRVGIDLFNSCSFTNNAGAFIEIDNITSTTTNEGRGIGLNTTSSFINGGSIKIGNTTAISRSGIFLSTGQFTNQSTGVVEINRVTALDAVTANGASSVTNSGSIKIGNIAAIGQFGFQIRAGFQLVNQTSGTIEINKVATNSAVLANGSTTLINNLGSFKVGNLFPVLDGIYFEAGAKITNQSTGTIEIDNISGFDALSCTGAGSLLTNNGAIKIGDNTAIKEYGIHMFAASEINNSTGGVITINRTTSFDAISLTGTSTKFTNNASLTIGNLAGIAGNGISVLASGLFLNNSTGTVQMNAVATNGININGAASGYTNAGIINLAATGTAIANGIINTAASGNLTNTGTITFGNITSIGISANSNLQNNSGGILQTGAAGVLSVSGIVTNNAGATITNSATGTITVANTASIINSGTITNNNGITNNGTVTLQTAGSLLNNNAGATCTNNGIIKGIGTINQSGTFTNSGISKIQPGLSPGTLASSTDFDLGSTLFDLEANATTAGNFDVLNVNGVATLTNATLKLTTGFTPVNGDAITVVNATSLTGTFATINAPGWMVNYNSPSTGKVTLVFSSTLPLTILSFTGNKQSNNALLQWKTTNEIGTSKFEVQRSDNGQTFTSIGTVTAGGSVYSFTDPNVFNSEMVVYYRLKSVDIDGRFTYSSIIKLSKQASGLITVYPNPVVDIVTVTGLKQNGTILLYNAEGKLLQQQTVSAQTMTMDMSRYVKGMYLLQYKTEDEVVNQKIIKQ